MPLCDSLIKKTHRLAAVFKKDCSKVHLSTSTKYAMRCHCADLGALILLGWHPSGHFSTVVAAQCCSFYSPVLPYKLDAAGCLRWRFVQQHHGCLRPCQDSVAQLISWYSFPVPSVNMQKSRGKKGIKRVEGCAITNYKFITWLSTKEEKEFFKLRDHVDVRTLDGNWPWRH